MPVSAERNQSLTLSLLVFLISCGLVSFQILLIYLFSITQWSSFAAMVISMALLGYGAAGSFLTILKKRIINRFDRAISFCLLITCILMILSVRLSRIDIFSFDSYELFAKRQQILRMLFTYFLFISPFFSGSLAIGLIYTKYTNQISKYYFFDLSGAALGGIIIILLLRNWDLNHILSLISSLLFIAGLIIIRKTGLNRRWILVVLCFLLLVTNIFFPIKLNFSQFKGISYALDLPNSTIIWEQQSQFGLTQVVHSPNNRFAPGLSLNYTGNIPPCNTVFNNGNSIGVVFNDTSKSDLGYLKHSTIYLPFAFKEYKNILILQADAGIQTQLVKTSSLNIPTCIISNKNIANYLNNVSSQLEIIVKDSRHFLQINNSKYDLIILPTLGSFGGDIGLDAFQEKTWFTSEAIQEIKNHLSPGGIIVLSVWLDNPIRYAYRSLSLLQSVDTKKPKQQFVALKNWGLITMCYKESPFIKSELEKIDAFAFANSFDFIYHPEKELLNTKKNNPDSSLITNYNSILTKNNIQKSSAFKTTVPTDNRPYFSQFLKANGIRAIFKRNKKINPFIEIDYFVHLLSFLQVFILAIILILLPLFLAHLPKKAIKWIVLYFSSIGIGFMFIEIVLIKSLVGYLGNQVYAATIVISILLFSSGLGSLTSRSFKRNKKTLVLINLSILIIIYSFLYTKLISYTLGFDPLIKAIIVMFLIFIPGFFMGMAFPMGLKLLSKINNSNVPWAWGINGTMSVIASSLAAMIIIETGFNFLFLLSGIIYGLAALSIVFLVKLG